jgi:hypothetical protein
LSSSISGTVNYAGTAPTSGWAHVVAYSNNNPDVVMSASVKLAEGRANYTLNGAYAAGSYTIYAYLDIVGVPGFVAVDPSHTTTVSLSSAGSNLSGVNLALTDPVSLPTPEAPANLLVSPSDQSVLVSWDPQTSVNGIAEASQYRISWGTDSNASTGGGSKLVSAVSTNQVLSGLANGSSYYFKVSSLVDNAESAPSAVQGPILIGTTTGQNTISGTITFPGTASGPLYALITSYTTGISYFTRIAAPVSGLSYQVSGVPTDNYHMLTVIDSNNDGRLESGEPRFDTSRVYSYQNIYQNGTINITMLASNGEVDLATRHKRTATGDSYGAMLTVLGNNKIPVSARLTGGPTYIPWPYTLYMADSQDSTFFSFGTQVPQIGDSYTVNTTYLDGSSEVLQASTTAVLQPPGPPQFSGSDRTQPDISWAAPTTLPGPGFIYYVNILDGSGNLVWQSIVPSTQTSTTYSAGTGPAMTAGASYTIAVGVQDGKTNQATYSVNYTP